MDDHSRVLVNSSSENRDPMTQDMGSHSVGAGMGGAGGETVDPTIERESKGLPHHEPGKEFDAVEAELQGHQSGDRGPRDPWTDARDAGRDAWLRVRKS